MRDHLAKMRAMILGLLSHSARWMAHLPTWLDNIDQTFDAAVEHVHDTQQLRQQMEHRLGRDIVWALAQWLGPQRMCVGTGPTCAPTLFFPHCGAIPLSDLYKPVQRAMLFRLYELVDICGPRLSDFQVRESQPMQNHTGAFCIGCHRRFQPCSVIKLFYGDYVIGAELCAQCFRAFELTGKPRRSKQRRVELPPYFDNQLETHSQWSSWTATKIW